jgi:hypothetical protein
MKRLVVGAVIALGFGAPAQGQGLSQPVGRYAVVPLPGATQSIGASLLVDTLNGRTWRLETMNGVTYWAPVGFWDRGLTAHPLAPQCGQMLFAAPK